MRVGFNPNKDKVQKEFDYYHQVVIPVYIPELNNYYKDSLEILKISLESLFKTIHPKTFLTLVNNGSCNIVVKYLENLLSEKKIHELIHTDKIGKLNAIIKGIVGHRFKLITIVDADVMFLNSWQEATYTIFEDFPKAGVVSTTPSSRSLFTHTQNIWFDLFFSKRMKFTEVKNSEALKMFADSVGDEYFYSSIQLKKYLTIKSKNTYAVVGAGHFMATYRADIFNELPALYSEYLLGGNSEAELLDIPVIKKGYWRLSTLDNYTYHLGNVIEDWMFSDLNNSISTLNEGFKIPNLSPIKQNDFLRNFIKNKLFKKLFLRRKFRPFLMKLKGLSKEEIKNYKC
ncbi:glycosyltransferase [Tenacibaculum aquimarinum]|uniref:glycosyltransferase n=1 Tax=Tenacibaculum aquimarinum TaxID=2910675 RepID=UPI001F0B5B64|nr:glycosyltransferase [Tenacibaculum aquimarinum]MCH3884984.1 glycosyltransferase [Tenacibaculum aquimarinum]